MSKKLIEITNLMNVIDETTNDIIDSNKELYENFKREYLVFIKMVYDRLKISEREFIKDSFDDFGEYVLSFGTDEFIYEYKELAQLLAYIDYVRGIKTSVEKYSNPLFEFHDMFFNFFNILKQPLNSIEALKVFKELTERCLSRLGFDHIRASIKRETILFNVDIYSRIFKIKEQFLEEERSYRQQNPNAYFIVDEVAMNNYIISKLNEWDVNKKIDTLSDKDYCLQNIK